MSTAVKCIGTSPREIAQGQICKSSPSVGRSCASLARPNSLTRCLALVAPAEQPQMSAVRSAHALQGCSASSSSCVRAIGHCALSLHRQLLRSAAAAASQGARRSSTSAGCAQNTALQSVHSRAQQRLSVRQGTEATPMTMRRPHQTSLQTVRGASVLPHAVAPDVEAPSPSPSKSISGPSSTSAPERQSSTSGSPNPYGYAALFGEAHDAPCACSI